MKRQGVIDVNLVEVFLPWPSRSDAMRVAVGFIPRFSDPQTVCVAEERCLNLGLGLHPSLRDEALVPNLVRGLKATATIAKSLRDSDVHAPRSALRFPLAVILMLFVLGWMTVAADDLSLKPVSDPRPILEDLQRKMSSLRSVYLDFTQERHLKLFTEPLKSEGVMLIERPDQIRWETTSPYQSILLGNHKSVAQFERTDGEWKKLKLGFPEMLKRVMEQMSLMHQGKLDALTADFTISVATGAVAVVTLVPKDKNVKSMLSSLEIRMMPDFSATREVVMNEPSGEFTKIILRRERRDVKLPAGTFDQTKPLDIATIEASVSKER